MELDHIVVLYLIAKMGTQKLVVGLHWLLLILAQATKVAWADGYTLEKAKTASDKPAGTIIACAYYVRTYVISCVRISWVCGCHRA